MTFSKVSTVWSDDDDAQLMEALSKGVSVQRLAVRLKRTATAIKIRAKQLGIEPRKPSRSPANERWL